MMTMMMVKITMTNTHLLDIVVMVNKKSEYSCPKNKELYSETTDTYIRLFSILNNFVT